MYLRVRLRQRWQPLPSISIATTRNLVRSAPPIPSTAGSPMDFTAIVVASYGPSALSKVWNPVNVAQRWYTLLATIPSVPTHQTSSPPFLVRARSNISCLTAIIDSIFKPAFHLFVCSLPTFTNILIARIKSTYGPLVCLNQLHRPIIISIPTTLHRE